MVVAVNGLNVIKVVLRAFKRYFAIVPHLIHDNAKLPNLVGIPIFMLDLYCILSIFDLLEINLVYSLRGNGV